MWAGYRQQFPALRRESLIELYTDDSICVFLRALDRERMLIAFSKAADRRTIRLDAGPDMAGAASLVSFTGGGTLDVRSGHVSLPVEPWQAELWRVVGWRASRHERKKPRLR